MDYSNVKKVILFAIPSLQAGGMERVMSELTRYFCQFKNYEVHLILYGLKRDIFYPLPTNINIYKPSFEFNNAKRTWSTIKTLLFLRKKIKQIKPDTLLSFGEYWNSFVLLANTGLPFRVFVSDRCQPDKSLGKLHDFLRKMLYPKAAGVICQTELAKNIYQNIFDQKNFRVIGNPIREIKSSQILKKDNIVLTVGRLIKTKHHDELIKIFAELYPIDWKLVIIGDDALKQKNRNKLANLIKELGMQEKIKLMGKMSNVDEFYNKSKIFAFTSSSEGFPNVIGEAMSAGLPVIAYDCIAGPRELIEHEMTGYLIELHNQEKFKSSLKRLIEDENLRLEMGIKAKEKIKEFSVEGIAQKFEKILFSESITN